MCVCVCVRVFMCTISSFLAIVNETEMNIGMRISLQISVLLFLRFVFQIEVKQLSQIVSLSFLK